MKTVQEGKSGRTQVTILRCAQAEHKTRGRMRVALGPRDPTFFLEGYERETGE